MNTHSLFWSIRREIWENRSIYLAPLIVTAIVLFATLIHTLRLPKTIRNLPALDAAKQHAAIVTPFSMAPAPIMLAALLVGVFYSLDALYGERRDRSILFWKSLPVSDGTTVLSKAAIPIVVLPAISLALSVITVGILLFAGTGILLASGLSPARLWGEFQFVQEPLIMLYGLTVHALWFAPIYCWLLLLSVWAKRTPLLWAVLPPLAIVFVEKMVFGTSYFVSLIKYRLGGAMTEAFLPDPQHRGLDHLTQLTPGNFLMTAGLWVGLLFAAGCLAVAVRLRRNREPI